MASKYRQKLLQSSGVSNRKFQSEYAKKLMLKMGWKEGNGLGKSQSGKTECVQVRRREDCVGLGIKSTNETSNWKDQWWNHAYNKSIQKLQILPARLKAKQKAESSSSDQSSDESSCSSQDDRPPKLGHKTKQIAKKTHKYEGK